MNLKKNFKMLWMQIIKHYAKKGTFRPLAVLLFVVFVAACNNEPDIIDISEKNNKQQNNQSDETMVQINKEIVRVEEQFIENYIHRHNLNVTKLHNGIRYDIYNKNPKGSKIDQGVKIKIQYKTKLLTGNNVTSSDSLSTKNFVVEHSEDIQGLHYAVQYLKEGESGIFIIPSHLAYGITGKKGQVPHSSALVYDIKSIKITDK